MAFAIPIPKLKRSFRTLIILLILLAGPYIFVRRLISRPTSVVDLTTTPDWNARRPASIRYGKGKAGWKDAEWDEVEEDNGRSSNPSAGEKRRAGNLLVQDGRDESELYHDDGDINSGPRTAKHSFLPSGLVVPNPHAQHPIYDLLHLAREKWEKKQRKASTTLAEAVDEYRRRYERAPPKGFDRWWSYVQEHNVGLPDEYDQIHRDLEPFHALTPAELQAHVSLISSHSGMYTISCPGTRDRPSDPKARKLNRKPNKAKLSHPLAHRCTYEIVETGLNEEGKRVAVERAEAQIGLLEDVAGLLEEVQVVFYSHDVPWQFVGHEYKGALEDAAAVGEFLNREEHEVDTAHLGWASACAPHKPLRETYDVDTLPDLETMWSGGKSFIWDHKASMDPCVHPTLTHLVGFLSGHGKGPRPSEEIYPVLAMCKTTLHADVLAVSMEAWTEDIGNDPEWEDKKDDRLLWRGKTTGIYFKDGVPWNISQRINLVSHAARSEGNLPILDVSNPSEPVGEAHDVPIVQLNDVLLDVAFVDEAIQCDKSVCDEIQERYKFGERKNWAQGNEYKYLLDIDGNGWSARFKRLMSTNSVVLKSTIFPEWYTDRIQPWLHYVPIKADLTDLYDVLQFFRYDAEHDALAKEIAMEGKKWSKSYWRKEDMVAYQFRLFLEYARLVAPDREKASFHLRGDDLR